MLFASRIQTIRTFAHSDLSPECDVRTHRYQGKPMNTDSAAPRRNWLAPALLVCVMIQSVFVAIDHSHLRHLSAQIASEAMTAQLGSLKERVMTLENERLAVRAQPDSVTTRDFRVQNQMLENRLVQLEQRMPERATQADLELLKARIDTLERSHHRAAREGSPPPPQPPVTTPSPSPASPPFRLVGLELRGGETFLAVTPTNAVSLAQVSVLRIGDVEDGWQLEALDDKSATFRFEGQLRRLELPQ